MKRLVVTGRIKPGRKTVECVYDNAFAGNPRAAGLVRAGLPAWEPRFPSQPKGYIDGDHERKMALEDADRV